MEKEYLFGKTPDELKTLVKKMGLPGFTASQLADWMYKKNVDSFEEMSNLSKKARELLSKKYKMGLSAPVGVSESKDGTKKYLFKVAGGNFVEAAYIPEEKRNTLCVSTQAGCARHCTFCMTGRQGLLGNLTAGEIINQVKSIPEFEKLTNIVYMGMGEPFDNYEEVMKSLDIMTSEKGFGWSSKRITVSTIGLLPQVTDFLEASDCHLAISLHSPFSNERFSLMPVEKDSPAAAVISALKASDISRYRKLSFEYIMFAGVNDSERHAKKLATLLNGLRARVNLIHFHSIPGATLQGTSQGLMMKFQDILNEKGVIATIRKSRGQDIEAACGLLSTKGMEDTK